MRLSILLTLEDYEALNALAWTERRLPRDQAAILLTRAIKQANTKRARRDKRVA